MMSYCNCDNNIDYCAACNDLKETAPGIECTGITEEMCNSLQKDTGLNPRLNVLHNNCEDLNDLLDCLLGRQQAELPAYSECDWQEYVNQLINKLHTIQKAMICSDCGQWKKIHEIEDKLRELEDRLEDICSITSALLDQQPQRYDFPTKYHLVNNGNHHPDRHAGISYRRIDTRDCDGNKMTVEWVAPTIIGYRVENLSSNDVLCTVDKATAKSWGITDNLWNQLTVYSAAFSTGYFLGNGTFGRLMLDVEPDSPNTLKVIYLGASYPDEQGLSTSFSQDNPALRVFTTRG
ncbi:hypothetical protein ACYSNR_00880 [Enterococcus sp. LJL128]